MHEPWVSKSIQNSLRKQKKLYQDILRFPGKVVTMQSVEKYKTYQRVLQRIKRKCKLDYYHEQCNTMRGNTKKLWQRINSIIKKNHNKCDIIKYLTRDNLMLVESEQIGKEMGK